MMSLLYKKKKRKKKRAFLALDTFSSPQIRLPFCGILYHLYTLFQMETVQCARPLIDPRHYFIRIFGWAGKLFLVTFLYLLLLVWRYPLSMSLLYTYIYIRYMCVYRNLSSRL